MPILYEVRDRLNRPVFSLIAPKINGAAKHLAVAAAHLAIAMLVLIGGTYFLSIGVHFYVGALKAVLLAVGYGLVAVASAVAVLFALNLIWGVTMLGFILDTLVALAVGWLYIEIVSKLLPMVVSINTHLGALACAVGLVLLFVGVCMLTGVLKPRLIPKYLLPRTWRSAT